METRAELGEVDAVEPGVNDELLEKLAAVAHDSWAGWFKWMYWCWDADHPTDGTYQARWMRQVATPYAELSEAEKESDRIEARKYLAAVEKTYPGFREKMTLWDS